MTHAHVFVVVRYLSSWTRMWAPWCQTFFLSCTKREAHIPWPRLCLASKREFNKQLLKTAAQIKALKITGQKDFLSPKWDLHIIMPSKFGIREWKAKHHWQAYKPIIYLRHHRNPHACLTLICCFETSSVYILEGHSWGFVATECFLLLLSRTNKLRLKVLLKQASKHCINQKA